MPPRDEDAAIPALLAAVGAPGIVDVHVHFMPDRVQHKVWAHFERLTPAWPITYRTSADDRLDTLRRLGVRRHTALAYAHRPGMAAWLNDHTLGLADREAAVVPTFTFYPEDDAEEYVTAALARGGACAKVHLQVGRFSPLDPRLDGVWRLLAAAGTPVVLHAGAVADGSGGAEWCGVEPVRALLSRHPSLVLVIAHAGAPDFADFLALAEEVEQVHLDTALVLTDPPYLGDPPAALLGRYEALGAKVVFGSDFPAVPQPYVTQVRGLVSRFDREWVRAVLWDNGRRLLG